MSGEIAKGLLELVMQYEPEVASGEPESVGRVISQLALSVAGIMSSVVINQGEDAARAVAETFARKVDKNTSAIVGKTMDLLKTANRMN